MKILEKLVLASTTCLITTAPVQAFTVTVEEPTVQTEQLADDLFLIDFDNLTVNSTDSFSETNSSTSSTYTYSEDLIIQSTNIYGGADNTPYIEPANKPESFAVSVNTPQKYFGLWWSAGDSSNILTFKRSGTVVATFNTANVISTVGTLPNGDDYYCNPTSSFSGQVCNEPYVFINFFFEGLEEYDEIVFKATASGGNFESDNHTFSVDEQPIRGEIVPTESSFIYAD
ncbi:hypothetical protein [Hyella patelloides]|nr:hypothetical protein [Hyella patelloides]